MWPHGWKHISPVRWAQPESMFARLKEWLKRRERRDPPIHMDAEGLWYTTRKGATLRFVWQGIREIRAYKLDLLTYDEVRFAFDMDGWWGQVSEDQPGFEELLKEIQVRFPSVAGWREKVILPPFERNEVVLYASPPQAPEA